MAAHYWSGRDVFTLWGQARCTTSLGAVVIIGLLSYSYPLSTGMSSDNVRPQSKCPPMTWTPPAPFGPQSARPLAVHSSTIALRARRLFVAGNLLSRETGAGSASAQLLGITDGRSLITQPPGRFSFVEPRAALDNRGSLHLMWAERVTGDHATATVPPGTTPPTGIWTSSFSDREAWSSPERLYEYAVLWGKRSNDQIAQARNGSLHLITPLLSPSDATLLHTQFNGTRWSVSLIATPRPVAYTSVAANDRKMFLAFISSNPVPNGRDVNSVFVSLSDDSGTSWSQPILVSESGTTPAHHVKARTDARGRVHLVWTQMMSAGQHVIRHVASNDGHTWSTPRDLVPPPGFNAPEVAIDGCGNVHTVFEDVEGGAERVHLSHAEFSNHTWLNHGPLFNGWRSIDPTLIALEDGRLMLLFLGEPPEGPPGAPPILLHSFLQP